MIHEAFGKVGSGNRKAECFFRQVPVWDLWVEMLPFDFAECFSETGAYNFYCVKSVLWMGRLQ